MSPEQKSRGSTGQGSERDEKEAKGSFGPVRLTWAEQGEKTVEVTELEQRLEKEHQRRCRSLSLACPQVKEGEGELLG